MENCIFCDIVSGKAPCQPVWESDTHLAFLSIFPNMLGVTVVIPKKHLESYAFDLDPKDLADLTLAAQQVGKLLDQKLNVGRTALIYEGLGVNHVHAKLYPLHGTGKGFQPHRSGTAAYFETYPGYVSSMDGERASDDDLERLAEKIRS